MAELLKRQHELLALKMSLGRSGRDWLVNMVLETHEGGGTQTVAQLGCSTQELGLPRYFESDATAFPSFQLPPSVADTLLSALGSRDIAPSHPLWLHLVRPYGYLGVVPWEDLLVPALHRPVLRLPDFLEPPRERRDTLDVALCCSVPLSEPSFHVPSLLEALASTILQASPRPSTAVHIFPDAESFDAVRTVFAAEPRVSVHDPSGAERYGKAPRDPQAIESARTVTSPWLQWMRDAMQGRSLDTVHFVCHGYFSDERASLTLAESPLYNRNRRGACFIGVSETAAFLTQTGAWSMACSAPPNNYSQVGTRYFVDALAQIRPGPALYHDVGRDQGLAALGAAYRFLFSPAPQEPVAGPLFMYCQPSLVDTQAPLARSSTGIESIINYNAPLFELRPTASSAPRSAPGDATVVPPASPSKGVAKRAAGRKREGTPPPPAPGPSLAAPAESVPNWLAAAQRYVEEQALEVQRRETAFVRDPSRQAQASNSLVSETLRAVQDIIGKYARSTSSPDKR